MTEIYQCLFDIMTTPNAPKPYRDLASLLRRQGRSVEADGVFHLLQQAFGENEESQPSLSEHGVTRSDHQDTDGGKTVRETDHRG